MGDPIVIEKLTKAYGDFVAVDSVDMKVKKNSFTGFLGPNGAGKSTTLKILTNLTKATSGSAYLNGIDVTEDFKGALANVGVVVETPEFYPYLTPHETFSYIGELNGMTRESIAARGDEILDLLKMTENADKRIGEFSKGMKQRVALGQALLVDPEIIILDEPTSGLDPRGMVEMREILKGLSTSGLTIFMSSHIMQEVSYLCDHVAIIERGKILADGDVKDLLATNGMRHIEVTTLNDITDEHLGTISSWGEVDNITRLTNHQMQIKLNGGDSEQANLMKKLHSMDFGVYNVSNQGADLERLYMELVKETR